MLDLLPVVIGDRLVLWLVPIGGKYDSEPVLTVGELVVLHGILVDVGHILPFELAPVFDIQVLKSAKAGRICGLLLA